MRKIFPHSDGFTIIELLVVIVVITGLAVLGMSNIRTLRAENRDSATKSDINAIYYQLESFHEKNSYYPESISEKTLAGIDPESLKDKNGIEINKEGSLYTYRPINCKESRCTRYDLTGQLEREAPYVKQSLNN
jgi:prepilin-type N-terminal cleavage/methylation domain-containing protein